MGIWAWYCASNNDTIDGAQSSILPAPTITYCNSSLCSLYLSPMSSHVILNVVMTLTPNVPRDQILAFVVLRHVVVIRRCDMILGEFYGKWRIRRAFYEAKEHKIWTLLWELWWSKNSFHVRAMRATQKTSSNIFLENKKELCHAR